MIKGKTPEEIRKLFNIVNDFTPEEEVRGFFILYRYFTDTLVRIIRPKSRRRT
jgi:hypothetical protein